MHPPYTHRDLFHIFIFMGENGIFFWAMGCKTFICHEKSALALFQFLPRCLLFRIKTYIFIYMYT